MIPSSAPSKPSRTLPSANEAEAKPSSRLQKLASNHWALSCASFALTALLIQSDSFQVF